MWLGGCRSIRQPGPPGGRTPPRCGAGREVESDSRAQWDAKRFWKGENPDGTGLHLLRLGVLLKFYGTPSAYSDAHLEFDATPNFSFSSPSVGGEWVTL